MKNLIRALYLGFALMLMNAGGFAQNCPNWSPKFDEITNPEVKSRLQQTDWDAAIQQGGGADAVIASFETLIENARIGRDNAARAVQQLAADSESARLDATWGECRQGGNALLAEKCQYLNLSELILVSEGSIELAQCRR